MNTKPNDKWMQFRSPAPKMTLDQIIEIRSMFLGTGLLDVLPAKDLALRVYAPGGTPKVVTV